MPRRESTAVHGGYTAAGGNDGTEVEANITPIVIISCILTAVGGFSFGYDIGISGGVTVMPDFLKKFFPTVYHRAAYRHKIESNYCKYENQGLTLFTSSLYLAGLMSTLFASYTTKHLGRKLTILVAGLFFIFGTAVSAAALNLPMLITGRIVLGFGVGFANQAVPVFLSEISPARFRGGLNILFQLNVTIGILFAFFVNYATNKIEGGWGWRLSLSLGGLPAGILTLGALMVDDTPNSLIQRGHLEEGKAILKKIRGVDNVEFEYLRIVEAAGCVAKEVKHSYLALLKRRSRPPLIIAVSLQIFQQFTGINAIMFYAPILLSTAGFKSDAPLYSNVIIGAINVLSTIISIYLVDRLGRRMLLLEAGTQLFVSQAIIAVIFGIKVKDYTDDLHSIHEIVVVVLICLFVSGFAWAWGPLGWLIPSEIFPLETRSAGQSVSVFVNLLLTSVVGQGFLWMLCHLKYGIFIFFSGWNLVMLLFVLLLMPETKNVPIEEMEERVWKEHWLWKRFMNEDH